MDRVWTRQLAPLSTTGSMARPGPGNESCHNNSHEIRNYNRLAPWPAGRAGSVVPLQPGSGGPRRGLSCGCVLWWVGGGVGCGEKAWAVWCGGRRLMWWWVVVARPGPARRARAETGRQGSGVAAATTIIPNTRHTDSSRRLDLRCGSNTVHSPPRPVVTQHHQQGWRASSANPPSPSTLPASTSQATATELLQTSAQLQAPPTTATNMSLDPTGLY